MKSLAVALALFTLPVFGFSAQAKDTKDSIPVTVSSKGDEVRTVLMNIFDQEKKQYVMEPNIHFSVYLSLEKADFHRALDIVCTLAGLQAELRDGVYFVHTGRNAIVRPVPPATTLVTTTPAPRPTPPVSHPAVVVPKPAAPLGPVPAASLQRHVTTRMTKASIRVLFAELSKQSGVKIVVDDKVPAYKLDAFLINTSLRYALTKVTRAAGLTWKLPDDRSVVITMDLQANNVSVVH